MNGRWWAGTGRRRAADEVLRLREELNGTLEYLDGVEEDRDRYKGLCGQLADRAERADAAEAQLECLRQALTATQAALANATKVSDLPQHVSTAPLNVSLIRERFTTGPVITLDRRPLPGT